MAGRDGTLAGRLRGARTAERLSAKTGSLTYVNALAGYATTAAAEPLAFVVICNEQTARNAGTQTLDSIAALLVAYPDF